MEDLAQVEEDMEDLAMVEENMEDLAMVVMIMEDQAIVEVAATLEVVILEGFECYDSRRRTLPKGSYLFFYL